MRHNACCSPIASALSQVLRHAACYSNSMPESYSTIVWPQDSQFGDCDFVWLADPTVLFTMFAATPVFSACCDFKPQCCVYSTSTSYNSGKSCVAGINSLLSLLAVHICMVHVTTYVQRVACCPLESYSHVTNAAACRLLSTCVLFACYQCCGMPLVVHLSRIHMSPMLRHAACCPLVYYSRVTGVAACCLLST